MNKLNVILPFILFLLIILLLWRGLALNPAQVPSPFINQPTPAFELPILLNNKQKTSKTHFLGHVTLLNVWATWCYACAEEHEMLMKISKDKNLNIIGLDYKDDTQTAKIWLKEHGNPYALIATDQSGQAAIDWGVYGTPETFIIDKKGIIRYKQIGTITEENWQQLLEPLIEKLQNETP
jgi:cytochrome c biogenesis protein CcmG/thiol:disulfide interchange protein DsbE